MNDEKSQEEKRLFLGDAFSSAVQSQEQNDAAAKENAAVREKDTDTGFSQQSKTNNDVKTNSVKKSREELEADAKNTAVIEVIKTIEDPEINIDIWTLELVYDIMHRDDGSIEVLMTFTSPMCPYGLHLMQMVKDKVEEIGVKQVDVKVTFSPAWRPSEGVLEMLGM